MALHKDLVEGELHEVKGASTASADQVLVSNGTGSTTFKKITTSNIDLTNIKNLNKSYLSFIIIDPSVAFDIYLPIPVNFTLNSVVYTFSGSVVGGDLVIDTIKNSTSLGTVTFPVVGTSAGVSHAIAPAAPITISDTLHIKNNSTGLTSAGTITILIELSY